ncbi:MAG: hypothetical protein LC104_17870, partial [Bacteroidales bacterium]|nr:hypothetical protein [Bacteroidales bacterium]
AYQSGSVPYGQTCVSEDRICQNGTLSGSYGYDSCTMEDEPLPIVDDPGTGTNIFCWFNGDQVSHGGSVTAYQSGTVPDGQTCVSETRTCNNGTLSGSYGYNSCTVEDGSDDDSGTTTDPGTTTGSSCSLDGNPVANGGSVTAYQSNHVPYGETCVSETRTCHNGTLSGSYGYDSCNPLPASHCVLYGKSVEHGTRVTAYDLPQARPGQPCVSEERVCNNGTLSGNYVYDSCTGEGGSDGDSGDDSGTDSGGDSTGTDGSSTTDSGTTNDSGTTTGNPPPLPEFDILAVPASFTLAGLWLARSKKRRSARKNRKQDS